MGAFFLVLREQSDARDRKCVELDRLCRKQGFTNPHVISTSNIALFVYPKLQSSVENVVELPNGDFVACTGTLLYRGQTGNLALHGVYTDIQIDELDRDELHGDFCIILSRGSHIYVMLDELGIYKVYTTTDGRVVSSSYLIATRACGRTTVDRQACYEYVFKGAMYGGDTIVSEVKQLSGSRLYSLDPAEADYRTDISLPQANSVLLNSSLSFDQAVDLCVANLRSYFEVITKCFGERISTALSGGYDSRLVLALLMDRRIKPDLHVYGSDTDPDVRIAKQICESEDLQLEHIDRSRRATLDAHEFPAVVERNYLGFDGAPVGGIFRDVSDIESRINRTDDGKLYLNGGGGEIFRNFFYLPDRPLSVSQFLSVYYSKFDPACCHSNFSEREYLGRLGDKIRMTLGVQEDRLTRFQIESLYPAFRCRYWMGRNNSIDNRFGYALTPFIDSQIVKTAMAISIRFKHFGRLEAEIIRRLNPRLAAHISNHGHGFDKPPPVKRRIKDLLVYARPPVVRKYGFRLKLRGTRCRRSILLSERYLDSVLPQGFVSTRPLFNPERFKNQLQLNRLATLEYMLQKMDTST